MKIKKKEIIILVLFIIVVSAGAIFIKNWIRDKKQEKEIQALINVEFNGEAGGTENAASGDTQKADDNVTVTGILLLYTDSISRYKRNCKRRNW